ncbi:MAG: thiolase family protein [Nitrospirae bacterium]|nr:thiolase family protein [Nitrospirota bacterium]
MERKVYVVGVGMTPFGKFPETRIEDLARAAVVEALRDSRLPPRRIQMAFFGHTRQGTCAGQRVLADLGLTGMEILNVDNACASGSSAFRYAVLAVAHGMADAALAVGMDKLSSTIKGVIPPREDDLEGAMGRVMPSVFAMLAQQHMARFGTTREQLALISVKNHAHGARNPRAQYRKEVTTEEVLGSRMICDPLTLLQCTPIGDGAAAAVVAGEDLVRRLGLDASVRVAASVLLSGEPRIGAEWDITVSRATTNAAQVAYNQAGLGPRDVDLCELHDCFTAAELAHYENLGFCARGEGGRFIQEGRSGMTGEVCVNPSGGLLSKGHPLGATGVAQVCEVTWQLRGQAGDRQVADARVGMTHTMGGGVSGAESGAASVHIFVRDRES